MLRGGARGEESARDARFVSFLLKSRERGWCRTRGCMGASGFSVAPVDGIVMNILVVEIGLGF